MATSSTKNDLEMVQMAQTMVLQAKNWAQSSSSDESSSWWYYRTTNVFAKDNDINDNNKNYYNQIMAMVDCAKLYDQAEPRLARLLESDGKSSHEDAVAWLSGVITSHRTCLDGLKESGDK
ncbi:putative pectinesterase/pectinesterase inhibitor 36 [Bienertia sinuspersici]